MKQRKKRMTADELLVWLPSQTVSDGECLLWNLFVDPKSGYGYVRYDGHMRLAHKVHWELTNGPVLEGMELDHTCRKRSCINLKHLEPVPHQVNVARGILGETTRKRMTRLTTCQKGHLYSEVGVRLNTDGTKRCRACAREWDRLRYQRRKVGSPS